MVANDLAHRMQERSRSDGPPSEPGNPALCDRTSVLVAADLALAAADGPALTALGAALWGLQMGLTQSVLSASVADAAPVHLRGTAFGIYDVVVGIATFCASAAAGALWTLGGPPMSFGVAAGFAVAVVPLLALGPLGAAARRM